MTPSTTERLRECVALTSMHNSVSLPERVELVKDHDNAVRNFLHVYEQVVQALREDDRLGLADSFQTEAVILLGISALQS